MNVDVEGLRSTIRNIEEQMKHLGEEVVRLRRIADDADAQSPHGAGLSASGLNLPPEIVVRRPDEIDTFVRAHPELSDRLRAMAAALVEEFRAEHSEIKLAIYQDPETDDRQLTLYVRQLVYDDALIPRIEAVSDRVDSQFPPTPEWILVTTDYHPLT